MTDKQRILNALRAGPVTPVDFAAPAKDGGKPIMRVAARIGDLRSDGHDIVTTQTRPVARYVLAHEAGTPAKSVGIAQGLRSLDVPMGGGPVSPYEYDEDVAA